MDQVRYPALCLRTNGTPHFGSQHVDKKHKPPPPPPPTSPLLVAESEKSGSAKGGNADSPPHNFNKMAPGAINTNQVGFYYLRGWLQLKVTSGVITGNRKPKTILLSRGGL